MIDVTNNRFEHFVDIAYESLTTDQQELYKGIGDFLRDKLIAKREAASLFSAVSWKLNTAVPFLTSLAGSIITFLSIDNQADQKNALIAGASVSLVGPVFNILYGFYQWYNAVCIPNYCEKQIQLIALYYAFFLVAKHLTANAIAQPLMDYLDGNYNENITLSQNALNQQKGGIKK
ncbi:MAG: hypothetical protein HEEMFOPI_01583 [Holosporales bacterium]